uniref:Dual specificity protein kinase shkB isoform X3 n=1 Tax=Rhizophora mucronata TaxID=61149 RepID=A0A2P2L8K5_RHIMU
MPSMSCHTYGLLLLFDVFCHAYLYIICYISVILDSSHACPKRSRSPRV